MKNKTLRKTLFSFYLALIALAMTVVVTPLSAAPDDWIERKSGVGVDLKGVVFNGELYVAVGDKGTILTSPNAVKWTKRVSGTDKRLNGVAFAQGLWVAVGVDGVLLTSTDGTKWTRRASDSAFGLHGIHFANGRWVAAGGFGKVVSSTDGLTWTARVSGTFATLWSVTYGNNRWIVVGESVVLGSADGITWTPTTVPQGYYGVTFARSQYFAATSSGVRTSRDGINWTAVADPDASGSTNWVTYGDDLLVVVRGDGYVALSEDGVAWEKVSTRLTHTLWSVSYGDNSFIGAGFAGLIAQSPPWLRCRSGGPRDNPFASFDTGDAPPARIGLPDYRVNTTSLNVVLEGALFHMRTRGPSVAVRLLFNRTCDSETVGLFGKTWRSNYEGMIQASPFDVRLTRGTGKVMLFTGTIDLSTATPANPITLTPPAGNFDSLTCHGTYFLHTDKATRFVYRYDRTGNNPARLTSITDRNGNAVTLDVNLTTGQINAVHDPANRTLTFEYTGGLCTKIIVPDGRLLRFEYDAQQRLTKITDMAGYQATYEYDADGGLVKMNTAGRLTNFTYKPRPGDADAMFVSEVRSSISGRTRYEFDTYGTVRRISDSGQVTTFKNEDNRTARVTDPLGSVSEIEYTNALPTSFTDRTGSSSKAEYDTRGNLTSEADSLEHATAYEYDARDNLIRRTDAKNNVWLYTYDANSNLIETRTPLGHTSQITYDAHGQFTAMRDPRAHTTTLLRDAFGNVTRSTDPLGFATIFTFDAAGLHCTRFTDARGKAKDFLYDANDRMTRVTHTSAGSSPFIVHAFDAFGETGVTDEVGSSTLVERNEAGFITRRSDPLGNLTRMEYDANNNLTAIIDARGYKTTMTYDDDNRPLIAVDPLGRKMQRAYNDEGKLIALTNERGKKMKFEYDKNQQLVRTIDPLGKAVALRRDELGRVNRATNARLNEINYAFDADGRLIERRHGASAVAAYTYDAASNVVAMTDPIGTTAYVYNDRNELTRITFPNGRIINFTYDAAGNPATIAYPDGTTLSYTWDDFNRTRMPTRMRNAARTEIAPRSEKRNRVTALAWAGHSMTFVHDAAARLTKETRSNGTETLYTYDAAHRCLTAVHRSLSVDFSTWSYGYDAIGNVTDENGAHPIEPVLPDTASATYDSANGVASWNRKKFTYDADGNLTAIGTEFSATYDAENRLISMTRNGTVTTYAYDADGNRVRRTVGSDVTNYHHDRKGRLLFETDGSGAVTRNYLYAGGRLVAAGTAGAGFQFYHFDRAGNTVSLTDSLGNQEAHYAYQPFGGLVQTAAVPENSSTFAGAFGIQDEGDGLFLMKRRFYDSLTGRFLQRDPAGTEGGLNLYRYGANNPKSFVDPEGTFIIEATIGGAIIGTIWLANRIYNAYEGGQHAVQAAGNAQRAVEAGGRTITNAQTFRNQAERNRTLNNRTGGIEETLNIEYQRIDSRIDTWNAGVNTKDSTLETAGETFQAGYHTVRAGMKFTGASDVVPDTVGGQAAEAAFDIITNPVEDAVDNTVSPEPPNE